MKVHKYALGFIGMHLMLRLLLQFHSCFLIIDFHFIYSFIPADHKTEIQQVYSYLLLCHIYSLIFIFII